VCGGASDSNWAEFSELFGAVFDSTIFVEREMIALSLSVVVNEKKKGSMFLLSERTETTMSVYVKCVEE